MSETVGILGGGGFLGLHLALRLKHDAYDVRVFSRHILERHPGVSYVEGLIEDQAAVEGWMAGCDQLLYLAHNTILSPYQDQDRLALVSNVDLFVQTLQTAARQGVRKILLMSSGGAVYGRTPGSPWSEDSPTNPISAYGLAKLTMEHYLRMFCTQHGISYLVFRPSNPYGPGQTGSRKQGVIPIFLRNILRAEPLEIWGTTDITKDYLYIDDFVSAAVGLIEAGYDNRCYNICSGRPTSLKEILHAIEATVGAKVTIVHRPARSNDVPVVQLDPSRLLARIPWAPKVDLQVGLKTTWDWLRDYY